MSLQQDPQSPGRWYDPDHVAGEPGAFAIILGVSDYQHLDGSAETYSLGKLTVSALTAWRFFRWLSTDYRIQECPVVECLLLLSPTKEERAEEPDMAKYAAPATAATMANITPAIWRWYNSMRLLPDPVAKESRSFFFFSGHGLEMTEGSQILLPADYLDPAQPSLNAAVSTENLRRGVKALKLPQHFFFVDACRSDHQELGFSEPLEGARILNAVRNSHINADAFTSVLHSTASGAVAWQPRSPAEGPSLFGQALVEGLRAEFGFKPARRKNKLVVQPEPLRAFVRERVQEIIAQKYGNQYRQTARLYDSCETPVTEIDEAGDASEAANAAEMLLAASTDRWAPEGKTPARPADAPQVFGNAGLAEVWNRRLRINYLQTGQLVSPRSNVRLEKVTNSRKGNSFRVEFTVAQPNISLWFSLKVGETRYGFVLPKDTLQPRYLLEFEYESEPAESLSGLGVFLSPESEGSLGMAARLWAQYEEIGPISAAKRRDLKALEQHLRHKTESPLAALVAATVLLRARAWSRLHDWLRNHAKLFPWIPDSLVLWNEQLILQGVTDERELAANLIKFGQRGLPYTSTAFSIGVRQVRDLLEANRATRLQGLDAPTLDALAKLEQKFAHALKYYRPGGLFAVFAGPDKEVTRSLVKASSTT